MRLRPSGTSKPVVTLLLTAGATAAFGDPVRHWLTSNGKLDVPNHRSSHRTPVPRGGGIAPLLGATTGACATNARLNTGSALSIAGLSALGWLDDATGHVPTRTRLLGQLGVGVFASGRDLADAPVAAITTAGVVNVFNFMDGINGISGLTAVVWGINAIMLEDESQGQLSTLGALTAGAGLGFLPHNLPTARLFLGDVGSYGLGTAMAVGILSQRTVESRYRAASPLLLYVADAAFTLLRRANSGQPLTEAHRSHVYQRLVDSGASHGVVASGHAVLAATCAIASRRPWRQAVTISSLATLSYLLAPHIKSSLNLSLLPAERNESR